MVKPKPKERIRRKYSAEFKRASVDRIASGESPSAVARELGIRRKFLYAWRDEGWGSSGEQWTSVTLDVHQREAAKLKQQVAELQRLSGQQAAELDFFGAALRSIKERRPNSGVNSGKGSIQ